MITTTIKTARRAWNKLSEEEQKAVRELFSELCPGTDKRNENLYMVTGVALDGDDNKIRIEKCFYEAGSIDAINTAEAVFGKYAQFAYRLEKKGVTVHCNIKGEIF